MADKPSFLQRMTDPNFRMALGDIFGRAVDDSKRAIGNTIGGIVDDPASLPKFLADDVGRAGIAGIGRGVARGITDIPDFVGAVTNATGITDGVEPYGTDRLTKAGFLPDKTGTVTEEALSLAGPAAMLQKGLGAFGKSDDGLVHVGNRADDLGEARPYADFTEMNQTNAADVRQIRVEALPFQQPTTVPLRDLHPRAEGRNFADMPITIERLGTDAGEVGAQIHRTPDGIRILGSNSKDIENAVQKVFEQQHAASAGLSK